MQLARHARNAADTQTIRNCWKKADILPDPPITTPLQPALLISALVINNPTDPLVQVERELGSLLDTLETQGALQKQNRMTINYLLNPEHENGMVGEGTNQEIFEAVMQAQELQECSPINGGDDGPSHKSGLDEDRPPIRNRQLLEASLLLTRHLAMDPDPLSRRTFRDTRIF